MLTSKVIYTGDLRTEVEHVRSGQKFITDAPVDNQGRGEAFSPSDIVSTALASCMMTIMGIAARTHNINMDNTSAEVTKHMESNPRRISKVSIIMRIPNRDLNDKEKQILENAAHTCPVAKSLHPDIVQDVTFIYG